MRHLFILMLGLLAMLSTARASSVIPLSTETRVQGSDAIFRGTVVGSTSFKGADGMIYTRTSLQVNEAIKGTFPAVVAVVHRGGHLNGEDEFDGLSPRFILNAEYLVFVSRRAGGTLSCVQGTVGAVRLRTADGTKSFTTGSGQYFADDQQLLAATRSTAQQQANPGMNVTDQAGQGSVTAKAITGLTVDPFGVSARFLPQDRGEAIHYVIDADSLPTGITLEQATNAVIQAFTAWANVTSLRFQYDGVQSFNGPADTNTIRDDRIAIQLHDNYNRISDPNVLGIGGRFSLSNSVPGTTWDLGGNVAGNEFRRSIHGFVVLEATNTAMESLSMFTEVLCHEIGHALSMAHSSEVTTSDPVLLESIMYFEAHGDGRGATLGSYDPPVIQQAYPSNTPPFIFNRYIDVVSASPAPNVAGINEVEIRGYDLQETNFTVFTNNGTSAFGVFSLVGNKIKYAPGAAYSDQPRSDPSGNGFYERINARVSDGTNASPWVFIRVISYNRDTNSPSDGIPNNWVSLYFGAGIQATNDADGDGRNNLQEYISGSNPTNAASVLAVTMVSPDTLQWPARAYDLYEVQGSTNLTNWAWAGVPVVLTNAPPEVLATSLGTNLMVTASNRPTSNALMFFRVIKVP